MQKKVLILSQYFLPDINAASYRLDDLYTSLEKLGANITVVTAYPQKSSVDSIVEKNNIHRLSIKKVTKKSFLTYLRNYFGFMFKSIYYCLFKLKRKKYDYIFVTSPPLFVALGGVIIALLKRTKLIVDIRDIWPESAVATGMIKKTSLLYRLTKRVELFIYKRADIITCVSEPMKENIFKKSGHESIHVLYNGISPKSNPKIKKAATSVNSCLRIGYAGNIGIVQNLQLLLKAAKSLKEQSNSQIEFYIIGDGIERESLQKLKENWQLDDVYFTGALSKQDTFEQLAKMDCLFFGLIDDPVFETTIPSKLFDYLLMNKPVMTSIKGQGRTILAELGCALYFEPSDVASLIDAIEQYRENKVQYDQAAQENREFVMENFNREKMFMNFFEKVL